MIGVDPKIDSLATAPGLKTEAMAYLEADVNTLFHVIQRFSRLFEDNYGVRFKSLYSASGAAMRVFRTHFPKGGRSNEARGL